MKLGFYLVDLTFYLSFSTLESGLSDETMSPEITLKRLATFSTLESGLSDETWSRTMLLFALLSFSTLESGLSDETNNLRGTC